jgi:hypothetical protein
VKSGTIPFVSARETARYHGEDWREPEGAGSGYTQPTALNLVEYFPDELSVRPRVPATRATTVLNCAAKHHSTVQVGSGLASHHLPTSLAGV